MLKRPLYIESSNISAYFFTTAISSSAETKNIPFVAIVGENEMNEGKAMLKNMETGEQNIVSSEELIAVVNK